MADPAELAQLELFSSIKPEHLKVLANNLRPLHLDAGEALVSEGKDTKGPLFIVTGGKVEVSRLDGGGEPHVLAQLEPPTVIGEMEFLADIESSATVTAHSELSGYLFPRARFDALFDEGEPAAYSLALSIGKLVSVRLADTNKLLSKALSKDSERLVKLQKAQVGSKSIEALDAELDALLDS